MPKKFLTSKYDIVFKTIFCNEDKPYLMSKLLESVLGIDIEKIEFLNQELPITHIDERKKIVDVLVLVNDKIYTHLEVNTSASAETIFRNYLSFFFIIATKTLKGENYNLEDQYVHIDLSYGLGNNHNIIENFQLRNETARIIRLKNIQGIEFNMDKIMNFWYNEDDKLLEENKYLVMLNLNEENLEKLSKKYEGDDVIMEYKDTITSLNKSNRFESFLTYEQDRKFWMNTERNKGIKEGIDKGISIGIDKGREEGITIGRNEGRLEEKNILAKNMLKEGINIDIISKCTNLPESKIMNLQI